MKTSYLAVGVGLFLGAAILVDYLNPDTTPPPPPAGPIPLVCERECLEGVADEFLAAMVAKDASGLPLSEDLRVSENGQTLGIGDGSWKTVTGRGAYAHYFADPVMAQVSALLTMEESGGVLLMSLRLGIELGRITEVETFTRRLEPDVVREEAIPDVGGMWFEAKAPVERPGRPEIIAVANAWFEAMQAGVGDDPRFFAPDCVRIENGVAAPCREPIEGGASGTPSRVHERRFPLVDAERGVVWAHSVRDYDPEEVSAPETSSGAGSDSFARSFYAVEAFLIEGGLIRGIEAAVFPAPYHSGSPWEGGLSGR